jgi:16S rRNA G966 N2-methylase RsmD
METGSGESSTLLILQFAKNLKKFTSIENNNEWYNKISRMIQKYDKKHLHNFIISDSIQDVLNSMNLNNERFDLIFVDDSATADDRIKTINQIFSLNSKIYLFHDYEYKSYRSAIRKSLKNKPSKFYIIEFDTFIPHTALLTEHREIWTQMKKTKKYLQKKHDLDPNDWVNWNGLTL